MTKFTTHRQWYILSGAIWFLAIIWCCCRKGDPLPGPETGLLSHARKWIVQGDTCADKARDFIGKGHLDGEQEGKGTQENCSVTWLAVLGFMVMGLVSHVVFSQSFWLRVLPSGACLVQPRWMPDRRILGGGRTDGVSFWPFLISSGWWRLISSLFLTRTCCPKTTHANSMVPGQGGRFQSACFPLGDFGDSPLGDFIHKIVLGNWGKGLFHL